MSIRTFSVDGTALATLASYVAELGEAAVPEQRGSDREFSGLPGAAFRPRVDDSRTIQLGLHILGQDFGDTFDEWVAACEANLQAVLRLFRPDGGRQVVLTRNWDSPEGDPLTAEALATATQIQRVWIGEYQVRITVDLLLSDPYFYGTEQTATLAVGVPATIANDGDAYTTALVFDLEGALTNPKVTNSTTDPDIWVKVGGSISAGDTITVDVDAPTVVRESDSANLIGALTHSGARWWMELGRGNNTLTLTADSGTGTAVLTWRDKWL